MALLQTLEKNGNLLFKYRGQVPFFLFILVVPVIYFTDYSLISQDAEIVLKSMAVSVSIIGFGIRIYTIGTASRNTSGRNTKEQVADSLNTTGIYSVVRHPLYFANYLMWAGVCMYVLNLWFFIIVSLLFWIYYERIILAEELFLERKFGNEYLEWSNRVPGFIPSFKNISPTKNRFSWRNVLIREYSGILATLASFIYLEVLEESFRVGGIEIDDSVVKAVIITLVLGFVLKVISKQLRKGKIPMIK